MTDVKNRLHVTTPGRICLFGEHQDYLNLPVIPAAISLRIGIEGRKRDGRIVHLDLPDIDGKEVFSLNGDLSYIAERDYFRSVVNVLRRDGWNFPSGFEGVVRGNIPINSGTSSSSALIVTWIHFLTALSDAERSVSPEEIARYAHQAEVLEFGEPGGMMDHFATAVGGVIYLEFHPKPKIEILPARLGTFVLGDSGEPKDTKGILARVKDRVIDIVSNLSKKYPAFDLQTIREETLEQYGQSLDPSQKDLLLGTVRNHYMTIQARDLLSQRSISHHRIGELLNRHQSVLRDVLHISTPKIDRMIDAALNAGALGGKINGSGGGGCMFAYAPDHAETVLESIEKAGGKGYIVHVDHGTRIESDLH